MVNQNKKCENSSSYEATGPLLWFKWEFKEEPLRRFSGINSVFFLKAQYKCSQFTSKFYSNLIQLLFIKSPQGTLARSRTKTTFPQYRDKNVFLNLI